VAAVISTEGIEINAAAPTTDGLVLSNSFGAFEADAISDLSYGDGDMADTDASPSYGDMAPAGADEEADDPALGGRPSNPTLLG